MKTVIITADGLEHRFVTKHLIDNLGSHLSGVVIERGMKSESLTVSLRKAVHRYGVLTVIERLVTKLVRKLLRAQNKQYSAFQKVLGQVASDTYLPAEMPVLEVESANQKECIKWIEDIDADYIFIYGTGIIGAKILSLPKVQALNLHTGISPIYRGSGCAFWPLYNDEPLMLGSTVHKCTSEVDGGDIYDRISVRLSQNDGPEIAFAKSVHAGAALYANVAKLLVNEEMVSTEKQDFSLGTEYRFKDKTFIHELIMEYRILTGKVRKTINESKDSSLPYYDPDISNFSDAK